LIQICKCINLYFSVDSIVLRRLTGFDMRLTSKEIKTLELLKECKTQKEVAKVLGVTESNVSRTIKRAKEKIIKSREIYELAKRKGFLDLLGITE